MNIHDDAEAVRTHSRTHVVLLADVLDQAIDASALRSLILEGASTEEYRLYWPVPSDRMVFSGPAPQNRRIINSDYKYSTEAWTPRRTVRFVRLSPKVAHQFLAMKSIFQDPILEANFDDGLFIPDDVTVSSGLFEVTAFSAQIRLSQPAQLDLVSNHEKPSSSVEIRFHEIYIDESTRTHFRQHLKEPSDVSLATHTSTDANCEETTLAITQHSERAPAGTYTTSEKKRASVPTMELTGAAAPDRLSGLSEGVCALYRVAERCACNPEFVNAASAVVRRKIALEAYNVLLGDMAKGSDDEIMLQNKLRKLFTSTRLNYALRLIDPKFDHNLGRPKEQHCEWPPFQAKAFLAQSGEPREVFVEDMLALIIGGARQWHAFGTTPPAGSGTKQDALRRWLEEHGITGVDELKTAFAIIAWNSSHSSIPTPPKQSSSRGKAVTKPLIRKRGAKNGNSG